jgi:hypothetical protein
MAGFAAHAGCSVPELSVKDNPISHARAQSQHAKGIDAQLLAQAKCVFGKNRRVGVAFNCDRHMQPFFHFAKQVKSIPSGKIGRVMKPSSGKLKGARRAHPYAREFAAIRALVKQL